MLVQNQLLVSFDHMNEQPHNCCLLLVRPTYILLSLNLKLSVMEQQLSPALPHVTECSTPHLLAGTKSQQVTSICLPVMVSLPVSLICASVIIQIGTCSEH